MKRIYLLGLIMLMFLGCAPKIEYVPQIVVKEVKIPVALDIKDIDCDLRSEYASIVVDKMLVCIKHYKKYLESLKQLNNSIKSEIENTNIK